MICSHAQYQGQTMICPEAYANLAKGNGAKCLNHVYLFLLYPLVSAAEHFARNGSELQSMSPCEGCWNQAREQFTMRYIEQVANWSRFQGLGALLDRANRMDLS